MGRIVLAKSLRTPIGSGASRSRTNRCALSPVVFNAKRTFDARVG
jgi:hypothetical protein